MRELRSCDFCGADAAGIFEVLPPEFTPAPDQRRVILCADCEETLTSVIEPLVARLGAGDGDTPAPDATTESTGSPESTASPEPTGSNAGGVSSVEVDAVEPAPESDATTGLPADDPLSEPVDSVESTDVEREPNPEAESESADVEGEATGVQTEEADVETEPPTNAARNGEPMRPEPPKFRQVIRILQNREFPVERAEVEDLASNAYGLETDEVRDIFDYAIERDLLEEKGGQLYRA
ncbi:hypothetical protein ACFQJC_16650 [Haloferax namakaokahaiae]|uniref:DUF5817 domain-containing protein n=1 Tax=Haloferax namakaokahaiae TaxID=1748331 RepID=A0ABD5ZJK4_9EURY